MCVFGLNFCAKKNIKAFAGQAGQTGAHQAIAANREDFENAKTVSRMELVWKFHETSKLATGRRKKLNITPIESDAVRNFNEFIRINPFSRVYFVDSRG